MTDRARELLERACDVWDDAYYSHAEMHVVFNEIRAYLAEPEVKLEVLKNTDIFEKFPPETFSPIAWDWFCEGIRFAEKHHGIGGGDE